MFYRAFGNDPGGGEEGQAPGRSGDFAFYGT